MEKESIIKEPIQKITAAIEEVRASTILVGHPGSGKTTVLKNLVKEKQNRQKIYIDGSIQIGEFIHLYKQDIFNLYHIALIVKKMLLYIQKNYPYIYNHYYFLENNVHHVLKTVDNMYITDTYFREITEIDSYLCENPEMLIEWFLELTFKYLSLDNITVILDNFDVSSASNRFYQRLMYNTLNRYLKLIITVSDSKVIANPVKIKRLQQSNQVIMVNYGEDLDIVKEILDRMIIKEHLISKQDIFTKRVVNLLPDDLINHLIIETNGNISFMSYMVREFYRHLKELTPNDYEAFFDNYLNNLRLNYLPKRKLYI